MKAILFSSRIFLWSAGVSLTALSVSMAEATNTQIQIDNTLSGINSHDINAIGTNYKLSNDDGRTVGSNLFFSFSNFNVGTGDTAWFELHMPGLANVISRVTGGSESVIDGPLKMTNVDGAPNFFFINPAGITFKSGAKVDVPGSFYVSTASTLNFNNGEQYAAYGTGTSSTLSAASPESFGFLGSETGTINIGGFEPGTTTLNFKPGKEVAFVANQVKIENATITNEDISMDGIKIQLNATGNGIAQIRPGIHPDQPVLGEVTIENSRIEASGNGSGYLAIQSGNLTVSDSRKFPIEKGGEKINFDYEIGLFAHNTGENQPTETKTEGINIFVQSDMTINHASIRSDAIKGGNGSPVSVDVGGQLDILDRGRIVTYANEGSGTAGAITVHAGKLRIDGTNSIAIDNGGFHFYPDTRTGSGNDVDLFDANSILSKTFSQKDAGAVTVNVDGMLELLGTGKINSSAVMGKGNAGKVTVTASDIIIKDSISYSPENEGIYINSGISAPTFQEGGAGDVTVKVADSLVISNNGSIAADSFGNGSGGNVYVHAGQLTMSEVSFISSDVLNKGNAGSVKVVADGFLNMYTGSAIGARPLAGGGLGGEVTVNARQMLIDKSEVSSSTAASSNGDAGDVTVEVTDFLAISNSGSIKSETSSNIGSAGDITVKAGRIKIEGPDSEISSSANNPSSGKTGDINILFTDLLFLDNFSKIKTTTPNGDGGAIAIAKIVEPKDEKGNITGVSGDIIYLRNSQITTSVEADPGGKGGNIDIFARNLILNGGFIQANTKATGASGGEVNVNVLALIPSGNFLILNGTRILENEPHPNSNVIQAVAENGASVEVKAPPPQLNLSGLLANLAIESFDSNALNRNMCTVEEGSTMLQSGKGGLPIRARDFLLTPTY